MSSFYPNYASFAQSPPGLTYTPNCNANGVYANQFAAMNAQAQAMQVQAMQQQVMQQHAMQQHAMQAAMVYGSFMFSGTGDPLPGSFPALCSARPPESSQVVRKSHHGLTTSTHLTPPQQ